MVWAQSRFHVSTRISWSQEIPEFPFRVRDQIAFAPPLHGGQTRDDVFRLENQIGDGAKKGESSLVDASWPALNCFDKSFDLVTPIINLWGYL